MEAPRRHDLIPASCVNKEVVNFNRKLQNVTKKFDNTETVKMSTKGDHFTRHGLHINGRGKAGSQVTWQQTLGKSSQLVWQSILSILPGK